MKCPECGKVLSEVEEKKVLAHRDALWDADLKIRKQMASALFELAHESIYVQEVRCLHGSHSPEVDSTTTTTSYCSPVLFTVLAKFMLIKERPIDPFVLECGHMVRTARHDALVDLARAVVGPYMEKIMEAYIADTNSAGAAKDPEPK